MALTSPWLKLGLDMLFYLPTWQKTNNNKVKIKAFSKAITKQTLKNYTKEEVSLHRKRDDCWIIVKDKVYDVTSYVEEHPGGDSILKHAGDDSTKGFYGEGSIDTISKANIPTIKEQVVDIFQSLFEIASGLSD
ncbi:hypothetical protein HPP92_026115 [Vanilla planifolia]|uniref:Cytochrome b5 heme-binding domain-containing protein n=1 Tax=Vanilla planifolia TaxID=51239 RepID=A0A835PHV8_VANPL|nr:hypothetical protein HPP92_026115 [Vanilla planifolia]